MKRFTAVVALLLAVCLLAGCSDALNKVVPPQEITVEDLTLSLPGYFINWSKEDWAAGFPFVYGFDSSAVLGVKESVSTLEASLSEVSARKYADLFLEYNGLDSTVSEADGLITFSYTANAQETEITYLCGVFKGSTHFWVIQCYCASADYGKFQADFLQILKSVRV